MSHNPIRVPRVAVAVIVRRPDTGRVLKLHRGATVPRDPGKWEFAGGKVEFGEALIDAARRELFEETGLAVEVHELTPVGVVEAIDVAAGEHWIEHVYACFSGDDVMLEVDGPFTEFRWADPADQRFEMTEVAAKAWALRKSQTWSGP